MTSQMRSLIDCDLDDVLFELEQHQRSHRCGCILDGCPRCEELVELVGDLQLLQPA